ncbi:MAG: glycosyl hydrolase [Salinivirgaceae bacterium]|jgi:mannan endo-1,4-beta-mannosidase|nr:glycosyl hydrolase [Salinivirgaceae bacterium]
MKSILLKLGVLLLTVFFVTSSYSQGLVRTKTGILSYLKTVISNNTIIVGQQASRNGLYDDTGCFNTYIQGLYNSTGKYPAIYGEDYGYFAGVPYNTINQLLINHWNRGGLVELSWCADCPWLDGYSCSWNSITNKATIDLTLLLKNAPESSAKTIYRNELMAVGAALQALKNAGVVVLWRPFHEMNGSWFWWGIDARPTPTNKAEYEALWRDMYTTFTQDLGLDNLIWVYGANRSAGYWASISAMYPGADVVDIVGVDTYDATPEFADYAALQALNKPIAITENGPTSGAYGSYDQQAVINTYKGKAAYFLQWHSWSGAKVAIIDNLNYNAMMWNPSAITLDELSTAITDVKAANAELEIYPNPANEWLNLKMPVIDGEYVSVEFLDLQGRTLLTQKFSNVNGEGNLFRINTSALSNGTYLVKVNNRKTVRTKLVFIAR